MKACCRGWRYERANLALPSSDASDQNIAKRSLIFCEAALSPLRCVTMCHGLDARLPGAKALGSNGGGGGGGGDNGAGGGGGGDGGNASEFARVATVRVMPRHDDPASRLNVVGRVMS